MIDSGSRPTGLAEPDQSGQHSSRVMGLIAAEARRRESRTGLPDFLERPPVRSYVKTLTGAVRASDGLGGVSAREYDKCMKRITVSLPDELAEKVRRAAGGERRVSSYVAAALEDYAERENLEEVVAGWNAETPVPEEVRRQVRGELDHVGLTGTSGRDDRLAG